VKARTGKPIKKIIALMVCGLVAFSLLGCSGGGQGGGSTSDNKGVTSAPQETIELNLNHLWGETGWQHNNVYLKWKQMIEEKTDGRVKLTIYPASTLAKGGDIFDAVKSGAIDIGVDSGAYYAGRFPLWEGTQLPFLGAQSSRAASRAWMDLYAEIPELQKEYADVHVLWMYSQGPGQLVTRKPVHKMEDVKGLVVRAPGRQGDFIRSLGASLVDLPGGECYMALSKGTVDATGFPMEAVITWKLQEVCKYITVGDFYVQWFFVIMNKDKYESLPADIRQAIDECSGVTMADLTGKAWDDADKAAAEAVQAAGMEIIRLSPEEKARWAEAVKPITEQWIADMEAKGLPGKTFVERAKELLEKYNQEFGSWHS
jgi:TRAP-type C4-dicarboxylate transport system substrate-binding protein